MKSTTLSFPIDCVTSVECVAWCHKKIKKKDKSYICVSSLHLLTEGLEHLEIRRAIGGAGLVVPDGMPLVWALRWKGCNKAERIYGPDLMLRFCEEAKKQGWRVGLLGGSNGQTTRLKKVLENRYSGIGIVCAIDTPRRPISEKENNKIIDKINTEKPNVLFVGLGCPQQELWMAENIKNLKPMVLVGVGAAFNFLTGDVMQAPRCMQKAGMEWFFRITQEPVRLIPRYIQVSIVLLKYYLGFYTHENTSHS